MNKASTPKLRIYLLGQFRVERKNGNEWQTVDNRTWHRRRARSLLGCLLSSTGRRLGREQLMELLWPDLDIEIAANRLNGAVHELRQILEPDLSRPAASQLLRLENDILELANSNHIWVDAEAFENLLKAANSATELSQAEHLLEEALSLYGGSYLLEELYSEWATQRRDALQRSWIGLLLKLAEMRADRGAFVNAIEILDRLCAAEPTNETALQRLMIILTQLDRRGEALQAYRQYAMMQRRDYENEPLPETQVLYESLLQGFSPDIYKIKSQILTSKESTNNIASIFPYTAHSQELLFSRPTFQSSRQNQSPLVGRNHESEIMRQVLLSIEDMDKTSTRPSEKETATADVSRPTAFQTTKTSFRSRTPHFLLLQGEPGIGKTRLAEELSLDAYTHGWAVA